MDAFRQLREAWFRTQLQLDAHEREWESEASESQRLAYNAEMKAIFDADTEAIIRGENRPIAPTCWHDLDTPNSTDSSPR